jgi:membrane protein YdbS with pleckstrin-like domain
VNPVIIGHNLVPYCHGMAGHVFISYSHRNDGTYVANLAKHLTRAGFTVWYDKEIVSGNRWTSVIQHMVDTCAALIVVMTPEADRSEWVDNEISQARHRGRPILPLLLRGERFFTLATTHYEDVTGGRMPSAAFLRRLRELVGEPDTAPDSAPAHVAEARDRTQAPENPIGNDEDVVLNLRKHWLSLVGPVLGSTLVCAALVLAAATTVAPILFNDAWELVIVRFAVAITFLRFSVWPILVWLNSHYVFTTDRILVRRGFLAAERFDLPYHRMNDVNVRPGLLGRLFGFGTLVIDIAGTNSPETLTSIPRVLRVHRLLVELIQADLDRWMLDKDQDQDEDELRRGLREPGP